MKADLVLIDYLSYSFSHTKVNSAFIEALRGKYKKIFCEKEHGEELERLIGKIPGLVTVRRKKGWRMLREIYFLYAVLVSRNKKIMLLGGTGFQALILAVLTSIRVLPRGVIRYVIHSELEGLSSESKGLQKKMFALAVHHFNLFTSVKCAVLSDHILESNELKAYNPSLLSLVPHPPMQPLMELSPKFDPSISIKNVAIIGLIRSDTKDIDRINTFAKMASIRGIRVFAFGRKARGVVLSDFVVDATTASHYTEEDICSNLKNVDAILCAHRPEKYRLTASGGAFDWLVYRKIGLFLKHPCFSFLEGADGTVMASTETELLDKISKSTTCVSESIFDDFFNIERNKFLRALEVYVFS